MNINLKNKIALVTGGTHGIGRSIGLFLADEGCQVIICARNKLNLEGMAIEFEKRKMQHLEIQCDVLDRIQIDNVIEEVICEFETLDILINNVGGGGRWGNLEYENTNLEVWSEVYQKNAGATIQFTMGFLPYMIKQKWGRVVTISSIYGYEAGGRPWFNIAKASEICLMKNLSKEPRYTRNNITFNSIAPGAIMIPDTGWSKIKENNFGEYSKFIESLPLGRLGTPEEIANIVVFLCSDQAKLINGNCIVADSGESHKC